MEFNILNIILVFSFAFVSVALGIRWLGQALIDYRLAKLGMMMQHMDEKEFKKMMEDEDER
tara:strand:- start:159 stop:341 length:183 start_codon:yes stop_codon:yes gene_type:complete